MEKFNAKLGYTQSDEMTILIAPTSIVRGEQMPHTRNGRVTKLTTLAAGYLTSTWVLELANLCHKKNATE